MGRSISVYSPDLNDNFEDRSTLVSRNITVFKKRTSIRLEPEMWKALSDIARREGCTIHDICSVVSARKPEATSLTAAIRVFLMLYYRAAATEDGHKRSGHGSFHNMVARARLDHAVQPAARLRGWPRPQLVTGGQQGAQAGLRG